MTVDFPDTSDGENYKAFRWAMHRITGYAAVTTTRLKLDWLLLLPADRERVITQYVIYQLGGE